MYDVYVGVSTLLKTNGEQHGVGAGGANRTNANSKRGNQNNDSLKFTPPLPHCRSRTWHSACRLLLLKAISVIGHSTGSREDIVGWGWGADVGSCGAVDDTGIKYPTTLICVSRSITIPCITVP